MIKNLVISGGGFKTMPVIGSLKYFEEKGILNHIVNYYGTSAGSIYCLMLILEYTIAEIEQVMLKFDPSKFLVMHENIDLFLSQFNLYDDDKFQRFIQLLLLYKKYDKDITLYQLYNKTNKTLTCATISLTYKKVKYFNHINQPNMPVYVLIMMTSAVPLVFKPVTWKNDKYVDGGLVDNFPMFIIPPDEHRNTLGIYAQVKFKKVDVQFKNIIDYLTCLLSISTLTCKRAPHYNIIVVTVNEHYGTSLVSINITNEKKQQIIEKGYIDTKNQYEQMKDNFFVSNEIKRRNSF